MNIFFVKIRNIFIKRNILKEKPDNLSQDHPVKQLLYEDFKSQNV